MINMKSKYIEIKPSGTFRENSVLVTSGKMSHLICAILPL